MPTQPRVDRLILTLEDQDLEKFVRAWVSKKSDYHEVTAFAGSSDRGRDVVGFLTKDFHEGDWHNYQCKQYGTTLPTAQALGEIGKILYYAYKGEFTAPQRYWFVAPRGLNRNIKKLLYNPKLFKETLIEEWDQYCRNTIVKNTPITLDDELRAFVEAYDFSNIKHHSLDDIIADPAAKPVLHEWFNLDPGPAPKGVAPPEIGPEEMRYILQLLDAYGEREGVVYKSHADLQPHPDHWPDLCRQRERYFDAAAFDRFYRDNTYAEELATLRDDVYHGIHDVHAAIHPDALDRVRAVMSQAALLQPSGTLGRHARVPVKQGLCHHFVHERDLKWKK